MSRYTGPRLRILRALDTDLPGLTRKGAKRRETRPGQHGTGMRRRRPSEYALQLREKQIVRYNYGLSEKQMRGVYEFAKRGVGVTGDRMLTLLERRLDNVVFRCGLAPTIPAARQLVCHGHVFVNAKRVDVASARLRVGDVVTLGEKSRQHPVAVQSWPTPALPVPSWLTREDAAMQVRVTSLPMPADSPIEVDMQLVVEFYAR